MIEIAVSNELEQLFLVSLIEIPDVLWSGAFFIQSIINKKTLSFRQQPQKATWNRE